MLTLKIALRYLFAKKSHRAVNVISAISITGVAVATMAIVVVLSVFNGFTALSEKHLSKVDPQLQLRPTAGKVIANADSISSAIALIDGVSDASPVIEERAMLISGQAQLPVVFKAVGNNYDNILGLDSLMIDGFYLHEADSIPAAQISVGVANRTGLRPGYGTTADLYVPRRHGRINPANPLAAFISIPTMVSGVFQTDQAEIDNDRIFIPLSAARRLLDYKTEASAIDIALNQDADISATMDNIINVLGGDRYKVLDRHMQQENAFRMIEIEKWITFMMLIFILLIASFNILSTLSLMIVEKRNDSEVFRALGAPKDFVRSIFIRQGFLITISGGLAGIILGLGLSLLQQHYGLIKLAGDPAALTIDVYPVEVNATDILAIAAAVVVIAWGTSQITRLFTRNIK